MLSLSPFKIHFERKLRARCKNSIFDENSKSIVLKNRKEFNRIITIFAWKDSFEN